MPYENLEQEQFYAAKCGKELVPVKCKIYVHSAIGVTPITHRGGSYCDLLLEVEVTVTSRQEAQELANKLLKETDYADKSWFYMPDYWNQNLNSGYGQIKPGEYLICNKPR